ncbi:MAG: glycosyltransferase family 4 protein [Phaeodactylibacter sp.]|nr:glycosyltransferase family 4 protein [Phaeodactylibacter sp.]MCB9273051.1 glycosyltransferase family 4 protein [Lewinellaceae bacterium]
MKIAINTRFLLAGRLEGIGRYTYEVCRRLVQQHPDDEFLFFFDRSYSTQFRFGPNVRPVVLPPPARHPVLWYLWFEWAVALALKHQRPDVFFSPDGYLSLRAVTPTVMTVHDLAFEHYPEWVPGLVQRYYRYFMPRYCHHAGHILAVSEYTRQDISNRYQVNPDKISVCGNGCRDGFAPLAERQKQDVRAEVSEGKPYFLYIGAVHPRKNTHRLIDAFTRFKQRCPNPSLLLIAGRFAWQTGEVKDAYNRSSCREDIRFLGYVPDEALPRLLGGALCFVYPSLFEGFGIPILEAMHCEVPVITSNTTSMPEVAGPAALLVSPTDTAQLADALQRVFTGPALQQQLIQSGREQRVLFSWDKTAAVVYEALI